MKKWRFLGWIILCAAIVFLPSTVSAAENVASGSCAKNVTWMLDSEGTLTISGTGGMRNYHYRNDAPWKNMKNDIKTVKIENGVTGIGEGAFEDCKGLTSVNIPSSVINIGGYAFRRCSGLTSVNIPSSVTSISEYAFSYCSGLTSINIPSSVTRIGRYAFYRCSDLTTVSIPSGVMSIEEGAFSGCSNLTSMKVEAENRMYDSRGDCNAIIETSSNTLISGCKNTIIPFGVTSIGDAAFYGCSDLTTVSIPSGVTSIGEYAFRECNNLTSVSIPSGVTSIGRYAFYSCSGLTSVSIPSGMTSIGAYAFYKCIGLTSVSIPEGVTWIGDRAFQDCIGLTSVSIPEGVTGIGEYAFCGCSGLTSVSIPFSVTSIRGWVFNSCSGLTSVNIPSSVTSIGKDAFSYCNGLTSVSIPSSVTSIGEYAFSFCSVLADIYYGGSESEWKSINIKTGNYNLDTATIHYAKTEPDSSGSGSGESSNPGNPTGTDTSVKKHTITFYSGIAGKSFPIDIDWGWDLFSQSSSVYDNRLATAGLALSSATEHWQVNAEWNLRNLGFTTIVSNNYDKEWNVLHPAVTFGYKNIMLDGKEQHIFAVVVRGTTSTGDKVTDVMAGGFATSAVNICSQLEEFMKNDCQIDTDSLNDNVRFFVTGHSLGGAVANITAHKLNGEYGVGNVFGYTFAAPITATSLNISPDSNIYNIVNKEDGVPQLPIPGLSGRHGRDMWFHRISYAYMGFYDHFRTLTGKDFDGDSAHAIEIYMSFLMSKGTMRGQKAVIIHVFCPVDVKIYTSAGLLAGNITGNKADGTIPGKTYIHIEDDQKYIYLLDDDNYTISLTGTDTGTMEYAVQNIDMDTGETVSEKTFAGVQLFDGKQMSSDVEVKDGVVIGTDEELSDVKLFVLDNSGVVEKEILPDGNGTEVIVGKEPEEPENPKEPAMGGETDNDNPVVSDSNNQKPNGGNSGDKNPSDKDPTKKNLSVKVKTIKISGISKKIAAGKKITLKATVSPTNATNKSVTWKSSNTKHAMVNSQGVVILKKAGGGKTATITAEAKDGSGKKASYKIKIMKGVVKKVTIAGKADRTAKAGFSIKLKATVKASNGANKTLRWTSNNTKYATVNSKGKVTLKKAGKVKTVKITAMATDGSEKKAVIKIKIK